MSSWTYTNPVKLRFGAGVIGEIGSFVAGRPYLLVTHPDAPMAQWRDQIVARAGAPLAVVDEIEPNPSLNMLERICARLGTEGHRPALIVALGGGSVIDSAKFLAAGHGAYAPVHALLDQGLELSRPSLPLIAVPTTTGTGSDLTKWATIWDTGKGRKLSLNRDDLYAEVALVDPDLTTSLPWTLTLTTGLDALSHSLESLWNRNANPISRGHAVLATRDIMAALPRLQADLSDRAARRLLAMGATRAGLAFSNTQTALAHNISYPLTLRHGVVHGIACSFCLPEVMQTALNVDADCDRALEQIFGDIVSAPQRLRTFLNGLGVPSAASEFGAGDAEWHDIVTEAFSGPRGRNFIGHLQKFPMQKMTVSA
ncbi:MAG: iron-containing alcohol dehydrogenase PsrA [Paracoccus sp. (in: a-proteobacteria)]|nr:iron-containing alcohol dehydrogenase PsrA [Paracoccus sp. (in: a-proteobacteria)]